MKKPQRAIILMMDSVGIGGAPDEKEFGDEMANTLGHIANLNDGLEIPNLEELGLAKACKGACGLYPALGIQQSEPKILLPSKFGHAIELSAEKDTTSGHWEMAGVPVFEKWGHFPPEFPSFPDDLIKKIMQEAKSSGIVFEKILGNKAHSGTVILDELGQEHIKSGNPIFYTSADSNIQIAAHEEHFGLEKLYKLCEIAFKYAKPYRIARIIARPFLGEKAGQFVRTKNRHDYSLDPFSDTVLDKLKNSGGNVISIGKISDIYATKGITKSIKASGLEELWDKTLQQVQNAPDNSIIFTNFVDFDMLWGHRRDVEGYAKGLEYFDTRLPEISQFLKENDIVIITADHGNDPSFAGSDHTREQVPVILFGKNINPENIGRRETFADIGQTLASYFGLEKLQYGKSFL